MSDRTKQIFSYVITFVLYAWLMPWQTALIVMGGVAFHEYGHLWAAKRVGLNSRGFYLLPFVGGVALSEGQTKSYADKSFILLMGPIFGGALAVVTFAAYMLTHNAIIGSAAQWMLVINLFNLAPLAMLDGGQFLESIAYSLSPKAGLIAVVLSTVIAIPILWFFNPIIAVLMAIFGSSKLYQDYQLYQLEKNNSPEMREWINQEFGLIRPRAMNAIQFLIYGGIYCVTAVSLSGLWYVTLHDNIHMESLFHVVNK